MKKRKLKSDPSRLNELFKHKFSSLRFISIDKDQKLDIIKRGKRYQTIINRKNTNFD